MTGWETPHGLSGDDALLRFRPSSVRSRRSGCPQRLALRVRPGLVQPGRGREPRRKRTTYGLAPLDEVLDLHEFHDLDVDAALASWRDHPKRPFHPALGPWTDNAVRRYLSAYADVAAGIPLTPYSRNWARQLITSANGTPIVHEETVTGRRYIGPGVRELRIPRAESVDGRPKDDAETALAAIVLADGRPVLNRLWSGARAVVGRFERPERVRVIEIGCVDGSANVLFDDSPEAAFTLYRSLRDRLRSVATGRDYRPGNDCADCPLLQMCPAVSAHPGLLGVQDASRPLRAWSVTTGRDHRECGAVPHLRDLRLPWDKAIGESEATIRGRAVHRWIETSHRRSPLVPCRADEAPDPAREPDESPFAGHGLQARLGTQMAADHSLVCPLREADAATEVYPEHSIVVYDPAANVVVIAKVDLLYRAAGVWRVRETKTGQRLYQGNLLTQFPQLALALVLSAEGLLPGGPAGCRVELEQLTANGPVLVEIPVDDPELLAEAREVVRAHVVAWHADEESRTRPGKACRSCGFSRWCPDAKPQGRS